MLTLKLCLVSVFFIFVSGQSITECGHTKGCFLHPKDCVDSDCLYVIKWADNQDSTDFEINGLIRGEATVNSAWLAIGFSYDRKMGNDCVVMCQHDQSQNLNSIEHYFNVKKDTPIVLDPKNPTVGLSNTKITVNNGFLTCKVTRVKKNDTVKNYFDINERFYILVAGGSITDGELEFHGKARAASATPINFQSYNVYSSDFITQTSVQLHATLAITTWILFVSTGILIARYFKGLLEDYKPCKVNVWFFLHRPIMILAAVLSLASFLIILSFKKWKWIYSGNKTEFIHSIFGIVTLSLLWIQPIIALFRCDKEHSKRFIFNFIHFLFGTTAFILSIVTMFLACYLTSFESNSLIIKILIGWTSWMLFLVFILEILTHAHTLKINNVNESIPLISKTIHVQKYDRVKFILLIFHILISIATVASLITLILIS